MLEVIINNSNVPSVEDSDAKKAISAFTWLNESKKLVSLNGKTQISVSSETNFNAVLMNVDFQLRGVENNESNDSGISPEYFGSILMASQKGSFNFDPKIKTFFTLDGFNPLLISDKQEIYFAQRVSLLTLDDPKNTKTTLTSDESVLILLTPISSLARFQNAELLFTQINLGNIKQIDNVEITLPKYSLLKSITGKGKSLGIKADFDFDMEIGTHQEIKTDANGNKLVDANGDYIYDDVPDFVLAYNQFIVDQANEKLVLYSPWMSQNFNIDFDIAKKFLVNGGHNLKDEFNMKDGFETNLYKSIITAIMLTEEYINGFPSFKRDDNNKIDPAAEINGIKITSLESKNSLDIITNSLFKETRDFLDSNQSPKLKFALQIVNMLSVVIESNYCTASGNNKLNEFLDPFYFIPRDQITIATEGNNQLVVTEASLIQDFKVSLASKYYKFSNDDLDSLQEKYNQLSIEPVVEVDTNYSDQVTPDTLTAQNYSTNPSDRKSAENGSFRFLIPLDKKSNIKELYNIDEAKFYTNIGKSDLQSKVFYWNQIGSKKIVSGVTFSSAAYKFDAPSGIYPLIADTAFLNSIRNQDNFKGYISIDDKSNAGKTIPITKDILKKMYVSQYKRNIFGNDLTNRGRLFKNLEDKDLLESIITPLLPVGAKLSTNNGVKDLNIIVKSGQITAKALEAADVADEIAIEKITNLEIAIEYTYTITSNTIKHVTPIIQHGKVDKAIWSNFMNQHLSRDFRFNLKLPKLLDKTITKLESLVIRGIFIDEITLKINFTNMDGTSDLITLDHLETDSYEDETIAVTKLLLNLGT